MRIGHSSEVYKIDPRDILALEDCPKVFQSGVSDDVVVLIGDNTKENQPDTLVRGREVLEKAVKDGVEFVPTRIIFVPRTRRFDFISPLIRVLRYKYRKHSTSIYHVDPKDIRALKIERGFRTAETAYQFTNPKWKMPDENRNKRYETLVESMKKGYDDRFPIDIMLCRNFGVQDTVNQGHHRMSVAIDIGLPRIAVKFSAVGMAPRFLRPIFRVISRLNLLFKQ